MSFGLRIAAETFQRFIDVFRDMDFLFAYLHDILVSSKSLEEHKQHLRAVFERFQEHGLLINPAKCVFGAQEVTFLGYKVSSEGSRPLNDKSYGPTRVLTAPDSSPTTQVPRNNQLPPTFPT